MKPAKETPLAILRELRQVVVEAEDSASTERRRTRVVDGLRAKQAKLRAIRELSRVWRRRLLLAAACLALAACAWAVLHQRLPAHPGVAGHGSPHVRALAGEVSWVHNGQQRTEKIGGSFDIESHDRVRTGDSSAALLSFPSGASIQVSPATQFRAHSRARDGGEGVEVTSGGIDVHVPKLAAGLRFAVHTPAATIKVHGTRFSVSVASAGGRPVTRVAVSEGAVSVESGGKVVELRAGATWSSAPNQGPSAPAAHKRAPEQSAAAEAAVETPRRAEQTGGKLAPPAARTPINEHERGVERASSTLGAENALLEQALSASRRGDDKRAVALLDTLLARYPRSQLVPNAQVERFRALRRMGKHADAARQARRYLGEHPNGMAKEEARQLAIDPPPQNDR
jgi:hypothetical protein